MTGTLAAIVGAAIILGAASITLTAVIITHLQRQKWPHGRHRICPDPGCPCWASAATHLTKKGHLL